MEMHKKKLSHDSRVISSVVDPEFQCGSRTLMTKNCKKLQFKKIVHLIKNCNLLITRQ
jgi:hypothetical protein